MKIVTLHQPQRLVFGNGCAPQCAEFFVQRGVQRVFLVTSTPVLPVLGGVAKSLEAAGLTLIQGPPIDAEPTVALFELALQVARSQEIEAVAGVGGGSAMDVAKLVAALARGRQTVQDVFGINLLMERKLPLVCLPTTSGTGSEVSPNAILLDDQEQLKKGVISPHLVPDAAYVDPLLTLSVPPAVTAATGLDALTHCIEAYGNKFAHPLVDLYALEGVRLIAANLVRAVRNGADEPARAALALGSLFGGMCLGPVNTAAVHALAYPLGSQFHAAHGISNAVLLPHVIRFNLSAAPERYAMVACALGAEQNELDLRLAEQCAERLDHLLKSCGVAGRLSELGVPRAALPQMAQAAMKVTRLLKNNPREITEADAMQIYLSAY